MQMSLSVRRAVQRLLLHSLQHLEEIEKVGTPTEKSTCGRTVEAESASHHLTASAQPITA